MIPRKPTRTREEIYAEYLKTYFEDDTATENEKEIVWKELVNFDMYEQLKDSTTDLSQVWFPGVHVNIGGGNESLFKEEVKGDMEREFSRMMPLKGSLITETYSLFRACCDHICLDGRTSIAICPIR